MIIEMPDDNSIVKWKKNDKEGWKSAEIVDAIKALETLDDMNYKVYRNENCDRAGKCYDYIEYHCAGCNGSPVVDCKKCDGYEVGYQAGVKDSERQTDKDEFSCEHCKHKRKPAHEEPCSICKHAHDSMFEWDEQNIRVNYKGSDTIGQYRTFLYDSMLSGKTVKNTSNLITILKILS